MRKVSVTTGVRQRVFFVANVLLPNMHAHGIQIMQMCDGFAKNGCEVTLVIPKHGTHTDIEIFSYYATEPSFRIHFVPIVHVPKRWGTVAFLTRWATYSLNLIRFLRRESSPDDIVYVRGEMVLPLGLIASRVKLCFETHIKPGNMWLYKRVMRRCHALVTVTKMYADELVSDFGIPQKKIIVEPDAVDLTKFAAEVSKDEARRKLNLPHDRTILVYTGSDRPWKGLDVFKGAVHELPSNYLAVFVGNIIKKYENDTRFQYIGFEKHETMPLWLAAADYLVVTGSHSAPESQRYTSPLKLFEYMAARRPIIAFDIPSFREVLSEENVFFVPANNEREIAGLITRINEQEAKERMQKAYEDVKKHTWELRVQRILAHIFDESREDVVGSQVYI